MRFITPGNTILLASGNRAKRERLGWLLEGLGYDLVGPETVAVALPEPQEDGPSHKGNAEEKAIASSLAVGGFAMASDGGLVIPALKGRWDSLRTHRSGGAKRDDIARVQALVDLVTPLPEEDRGAYWVEAVALADVGEVLMTFQAMSGQGVIATSFDPAHVGGGFWVGAVWHFPELGKVYAELTEEELRRVGDHWTGLKEQVQEYFRAEYIY